MWLKDPDAVLDYRWDWADWLGTDTITAATITVTADGPDASPPVIDGGAVTTWLTGGSIGAHQATCRITTAAGRIDERTVRIDIRER